jgi:hypothetical protein
MKMWSLVFLFGSMWSCIRQLFSCWLDENRPLVGIEVVQLNILCLVVPVERERERENRTFDGVELS